MKCLKWLIPVTIVSIALVMIVCEEPFPPESGKAKSEEGCGGCDRDKYGPQLEEGNSQDTVVLWHFYLWDYENQEWVELPEADSLKEDMLTWEEIDSLPDSERDYIKGLWPSWCLHIYDSRVHLLDDGQTPDENGWYCKYVECGSRTRVLTWNQKDIAVLSIVQIDGYTQDSGYACIHGKTVAIRWGWMWLQNTGPIDDEVHYYNAIGNHWSCGCEDNFGYTSAHNRF